MSALSSLYGWQYHARQWCVGRFHALRSVRSRKPACVPAPQRLLLILTGHIGDTVMCTPLVMEARRIWPHAHITVLGVAHTRELLAACPMIDSCVQTPAIPFSLRQWNRVAQLREWIRWQRFDMAIIALGDQFAGMLCELGIPVRVGRRGHVLAPCLTHTYDIGSPEAWGPSERLNALRALGLTVYERLPTLWLAPPMLERARRKLETLGLRHDERFMAIHPFGSEPCKWWPPDRVERLADAIYDDCQARVVVVGGGDTRGRLPSPGSNALVDATGVLTVGDLMAVFREAELVISTDSGPFHVAGALRCPLVGLFRAGRPEHAGRYPHARVVYGNEPACEARCRGRRCRTLPCRQMGAISVADVLGAVGRALEPCHALAGSEEPE